MGEIADILKLVHEAGGNDGSIVVDQRNLGMAYAIPRDTESTVVESFGPWSRAEVKQVFFRQSSVMGEVLAEIQLIMSWRTSAAQQYIVDVNLDQRIITMDLVHSVRTTVRFSPPNARTDDLESYEIPFQVTVDFGPKLIGSRESELFQGIVSSSGAGTFELVQ